MIKLMMLVGLGGGLGAMLRFATVNQAARLLGAGFPFGTMAVNVIGSLLIGLLAGLILHRLPSEVMSVDQWRALLVTGFLGGFTTFSAFSLDALSLWERREVMAAASYIGGSVILSILAVVIGLALARGMGGPGL
ncbi:MAG: fluoride efflux transporter CrcB [Alphaproteobacteria bacterium]